MPLIHQGQFRRLPLTDLLREGQRSLSRQPSCRSSRLGGAPGMEISCSPISVMLGKALFRPRE